MLFNFQLRPVHEIAPWGCEGDYSLSWFGLTDGWFWLDCGGHELFRYSTPIIKSWKYEGRQTDDLPYADYQVVRLWEDILQILPHVLSPVPKNLLERIEPGLPASMWHLQVAEIIFEDDREVSKLDEERFDAATEWLQLRKLDSLYLKQGPRIWLWSDGKNVFIRWDNTDLVLDGYELWTAQSGIHTLPLKDFIEEVRSFDRRLMAAMNERVQSIQQQWNRPEIRIDKEALLIEQEERSRWLNESFERLRISEPPEWKAVIDAIAYFERNCCPIPKPSRAIGQS